MSLLPFYHPYMSRPSRIFGQNFGLELSPENLLAPLVSEFFRPVSRVAPVQSRDPKKFNVSIDVHQFAPDEISVKTIGREVVVEGKHEEKEDEHGYIMRHFVRKYSLPEGQEPNDVVSSISSDGILTITAPREPIILPDKNERIIPIMQTGPTHRHTREHSVEHLPEAKRMRNRSSDEGRVRSVPLAIKYI